jgi:hypothetical protein
MFFVASIFADEVTLALEPFTFSDEPLTAFFSTELESSTLYTTEELDNFENTEELESSADTEDPGVFSGAGPEDVSSPHAANINAAKRRVFSFIIGSFI